MIILQIWKESKHLSIAPVYRLSQNYYNRLKRFVGDISQKIWCDKVMSGRQPFRYWGDF